MILRPPRSTRTDTLFPYTTLFRTPMAKRLLRLLLAHPELVSSLGDQQLEILEHGPHLVLVRDLITLANLSGARHAGALLQAADPGSRSEERRVGKACVSTCRSRWSPYD